jgi:hypothetical protein
MLIMSISVAPVQRCSFQRRPQPPAHGTNNVHKHNGVGKNKQQNDYMKIKIEQSTKIIKNPLTFDKIQSKFYIKS